MENLAFGLQLTANGMGLVFGLLALLWLALTVAGRIDRAAARRAAPAAPAPDQPGAGAVRAGPVEVSGPGAEDLGPEALAAIAVAVAAHAAARRRQAAPEMRSVRPGSLLHASRWLASGRAKQTRGWTPRR
jgi:Na+-transporting methylmalonyl-CoA/oxaloacetate decarboxylase gamma subunit